MHTLLYLIWFLIPAFFFIMALWAKLEKMSDSPRKQNPGDFFKQGFFVLGCVLLCVAIDTYFLEDLVNSFAPEFMPLGFFQVILLPIVLLIGAKLVGPSQDILIDSKGKKKKR